MRGGLAMPAAGAVFARRKSSHGDGVPVGIAPASHHWLPLDIDKVPNLLGLDPRREPERTLEWMLDLLPYEIGRRTLAWDWSSSTCVGLAPDQAPETLSLHVWAWLDVALDEGETRTLLKQVSAAVARRLGAISAGAPVARYVDPKLGDLQQPIYVAPPRFVGLVDPFPGSARHGLRDRDGDVVRLAELDAELASAPGSADAAARTAAVGTGRKTTRRVRQPAASGRPETLDRAVDLDAKLTAAAVEAGAGARATPVRDGRKAPRRPRRPAAAVPPATLDNVLPLDAMARLMAAQAACKEARHHPGSYKAACGALFAPRAVTELVAVVRSRVARGEHDDAWRGWFEAGGIPEGQRNTWMVIVCSLLARSFPLDGCTPANIHAATASEGMLIVGRDWLEREWLRVRCDASVLHRVARAQAGERVVFAGRDTDPRYEYSAARIIDDLQISEDEMEGLALASLSTSKCRATLKRRQAGVPSRFDEEEARHERDATAWEMSRDGYSNRDIAQALGVSAGTVHAGLARVSRAGQEAGKSRQVIKLRSATIKFVSGIEEASAARSTPDAQSPSTSRSIPALQSPLSGSAMAAGYPEGHQETAAGVVPRPPAWPAPTSLPADLGQPFALAENQAASALLVLAHVAPAAPRPTLPPAKLGRLSWPTENVSPPASRVLAFIPARLPAKQSLVTAAVAPRPTAPPARPGQLSAPAETLSTAASKVLAFVPRRLSAKPIPATARPADCAGRPPLPPARHGRPSMPVRIRSVTQSAGTPTPPQASDDSHSSASPEHDRRLEAAAAYREQASWLLRRSARFETVAPPTGFNPAEPADAEVFALHAAALAARRDADRRRVGAERRERAKERKQERDLWHQANCLLPRLNALRACDARIRRIAAEYDALIEEAEGWGGPRAAERYSMAKQAVLKAERTQLRTAMKCREEAAAAADTQRMPTRAPLPAQMTAEPLDEAA